MGELTGRFDSIYRPNLFKGKTVLITGGGTGIGRCTAHEFASLGARIMICGRWEEVPRKGPSSPTGDLVVRMSRIGGAENAACFAYPPHSV